MIGILLIFFGKLMIGNLLYIPTLRTVPAIVKAEEKIVSEPASAKTEEKIVPEPASGNNVDKTVPKPASNSDKTVPEPAKTVPTEPAKTVPEPAIAKNEDETVIPVLHKVGLWCRGIRKKVFRNNHAAFKSAP